MKTVFRIASFDKDGRLTLLPEQYDDYPNVWAMGHLPNGVYQVQKVFVKEDM